MKSEETGKDMNVPTTNEPTTEIVADLRIYLLVANKEKPTQLISTIARAADRLESQERGIEKLTARAEQAERERDAAVEHVHDAIFGTNHSCFYCTMENCDGCTNRTVKEHFKYRGLLPRKYLVKNEGEAE